MASPLCFSGSLKFDVFCDTLPTIAVARFSKENEIPSHEAFRTLLCNHVLPLAYRRRLDPGIRELTSEAVQAVFRKYRKPLRKVPLPQGCYPLSSMRVLTGVCSSA